jgi:hypothetical protein
VTVTADAVDIATVLEHLRNAAEPLDDQRLNVLIGVLWEHSRTPRPQLLIAGTTGSGRSSLVNLITGNLDLLPRSSLRKLPIPIVLKLGAAPRAEVEAAGGARLSIPFRNLRAALSGELAGTPQPQMAEVYAPGDLLSLCDLRVDALDVEHEESYWRDLLAGSDYLLLVLNATSPLSHAERLFVRDFLVENFGLQRVAIIINQIDRVPEDEREAIADHVRAFLGSFAAQPSILSVSLEALLRDAESKGPPSAEREAIDRLVGDVTEHSAAVKDRTLVAGVRMALQELERTVIATEAILSLDSARVEELKVTLKERETELTERAHRLEQRIHTFIGTLIREQLLRETASFGDMLRRRMPDEIRAVEQVGTARKFLPGYLERVWTDLLERQMVATRGKLADEAMTVNRMIEADLHEVLGDELASLDAGVADFGPIEESLRTVVMPKRSKHYATGIAKGLSLHGYIMLYFNPPLGVLSLLASQGVQRAYRSQITGSEMEGLVASGLVAEHTLEDEISKRINAQFDELLADVREEILFAYRRVVAVAETALASDLPSAEDAEARRHMLRELREVSIPQLRAELERIVEPQTA